MYPPPCFGGAWPTIPILDSDPTSPPFVSPSDGCWLMRPAFTWGERRISNIGEEGGIARVEMDTALDAARFREVKNVALHASRKRRGWFSR